MNWGFGGRGPGRRHSGRVFALVAVSKALILRGGSLSSPSLVLDDVVDDANSVFVGDFNLELGEMDEEPNLQLRDALLDDGHGLDLGQPRFELTVKDREKEA